MVRDFDLSFVVQWLERVANNLEVTRSNLRGIRRRALEAEVERVKGGRAEKQREIDRLPPPALEGFANQAWRLSHFVAGSALFALCQPKNGSNARPDLRNLPGLVAASPPNSSSSLLSLQVREGP